MKSSHWSLSNPDDTMHGQVSHGATQTKEGIQMTFSRHSRKEYPIRLISCERSRAGIVDITLFLTGEIELSQAGPSLQLSRWLAPGLG